MKKMIKRRPMGARVARGVILLTLLSTLSICAFSYYIYRKDAMQEHIIRAQDIAITVSAAMKADLMQASMAAEAEDEYWYEVKALLDTVKTNTNLEYLYIISAYDPAANIYRYYCEGIKPGDDPDNIGTFGYVEMDPTVFDPEALLTLQTGECTITEPYYSEMFGYLVTGFAPVVDANNIPFAVVGADINVAKPATAARTFGLFILGASILFSILFAWISKRYIQYLIRYSLRRVTEGTQLLSEGNLSFRARANDSNDDIGKLYANFARVISTFKMLIDDMKNMSAMHANGDYEARLDESKYTGTYLEVVKGVNDMTFMYVNNFKELLDVVQSYGNGNFDANVKKYPGKLAAGNAIVDELRNNLGDVSKAIMTLSETALAGNLTARASAEGFAGDWSKIIINLDRLMDAFVMPIQEASRVLEKLSNGHLDAKMTGVYKGDFSIIKDHLNKTVDELAAYIKEIRTVLEAVAQTNLTVRTQKQFMGDFAAIEEAMHSIAASQSAFFQQIGQIAAQLDSKSVQIAAAGQQLSQTVVEQLSTLQQLTASASIVNNQARDNAKNADDTDKISTLSMQNATNGNNEMQDMLASMESIKSASANIAQIMKVIDDIAFQTNILAINASIEAARAGEHGRGFAVVAEEVGNLARRSLDAAKQTQTLIDETLGSVNKGVGVAHATSETLAKIVEHVTACSTLITRISTASKEQADAVTQINIGINQISDIVQHNAQIADENANASVQLGKQSEALNQLLSSVKLS